MPKISVIIPVYNSKKYLSQCVDSVLNQSFKNFELILIDDESSDGSDLECDEYLKKDNRVVVVHQKNSGVSSARNAGLDIARGKYIAFIDSDDYIANDYLEVLYNALEKTNSDLAVAYHTRFFTDKINDIKNINDTGRLLIVDSLDKFYKSFNERGNIDVVWNKLYKKELFDGLRFPVSRRYEDVYLIHRLLTKCESFCIIDKHLYFYRQHASSFICNNNKVDLLWTYASLINFYSTEYINNSFLTLNIYNAIKLARELRINKKNNKELNYYRELSCLRKVLKRVIKKRIISIKFSIIVLLFLFCEPICYLVFDR